MALSKEQLRARLYEAFSKFGFFIFSREELQDVSKLVSSLSLHRVLRIRPLSRGSHYMIVEIDARVYEMSCRDECMRDHIFDEKCYLKCKESKGLSVLKEVLNKLEKVSQ